MALSDSQRGARAPGGPTPVFGCATSALPPPANWPSTFLWVTDLNILAHCDGSHWIRQDTGAII